MKRLFLTLIFIYYAPHLNAQVPDYSQVVHELAPAYSLGDHHQNCAFTHAVAAVLHQRDPRFGLLNKRPGQNQCHDDNTAVDAVLYLPMVGLAVAVDIIVASDDPFNARPGWNLDEPRYTVADFRVPTLPSTPVPNPGTNVPNSGTDLKAELDALLALMGEIDLKVAELRAFVELKANELQADHAAHEKQVESVKPKGRWLEILLGLLAAIGGGVGVAK